MPRPTFEFCGTYDGSEPASRWLKRLEHELRGSEAGTIAPELYLSSVDILLMKEAADWAETSLDIIPLLAAPYTQESLDRFLLLFKEKYPTKSVETITTSFPEEVDSLHQNPDETLLSYYQRAVQITRRFGCRDRLSEGLPLSMIESSMLDLIYSAFLKGLMDPGLRREVIVRGSGGRSLHGAFVAMEDAHKSQIIIKKIEFEETQSREVSFYKDVVRRNVSATKLDSLWASFSAEKKLPEERISPQFLLPSPDSKPASQPASIGSKSVTWSTSALDAPRSILKKDQEYTGGGLVLSGSVVASTPAYGAEGYGGYVPAFDVNSGVG